MGLKEYTLKKVGHRVIKKFPVMGEKGYCTSLDQWYRIAKEVYQIC